MQSIASIVGDVLTGKETYPKWSRKINKSSELVEESLYFVQKTKNQSKDPSKGDCSKRGRGRRNFRGRGVKINSSKRLDLKCKRCGKNGHEID